MPGCPPPDRLNAMLNRELADGDYHKLQEHVESCPRCRQIVEGMRATLHFSGLETVASPPPVLSSVSDYDILEELGRGGMGVVYKARQISLDRLVALKVIRSAAIADQMQLARFKTEAAALAQLQHPNIVQVFAVGEHHDLPYLTMEYVPGMTLATALGSRTFSAEQAAEMVEKLARAMESAHRRGVLHRDLKPSNVLLGVDGEPKIMDFGLAKRVGSDSHLTLDQTIMGTPSYMPPEQAQGRISDIGAPSDVYSLGAILYELLTAQPPFCGTTPFETIRQVIHREPNAPRSLNPRTPRDLETICLKCLHKQPSQRFPTAAELADDLRRFLRDEPIRARRIGTLGRAWRWCRRNPALSAAMAATALALVLGTAGIAWQTHQARLERLRGFQRYAAESAEKLQLIQDLMERVPEEERAQDQRLQSALAAYETWLSEEPMDVDAKASYADALFRIAEIRRRIGQFSQAEEMFRRAVERYEQLVASSLSDPDLRRRLAETWNWLGETCREGGRLEAAVAAYNEALKYQQALLDDVPADAAIHADIARSLYNRALVLRNLNRIQEAEQDLRRSIEILDQPEGQTDPTWRQGLARSRINLGILLWESQRPVESNQEYLAAIALLEALERQDPQSPEYRAELAQAWMNRGNLLFTDRSRNLIGDPDPLSTAESVFRLSVAKLQALANQFGNVPRYRKDLANCLNGLAVVFLQQERTSEAEAAWRDAAAELEGLIARSPQVADYHALLAQIHFNLALLHRQVDDASQLQAYLRNAVERQRQAVSLSPTNVLHERTLATYERPLARVLIDSGDYLAAAEIAEQLAHHAGDDSRLVYAAAKVLAECALAAEKDTALDRTQGAERTERYRSRAEQLVEVCRNAGLSINPNDFPGL